MADVNKEEIITAPEIMEIDTDTFEIKEDKTRRRLNIAVNWADVSADLVVPEMRHIVSKFCSSLWQIEEIALQAGMANNGTHNYTLPPPLTPYGPAVVFQHAPQSQTFQVPPAQCAQAKPVPAVQTTPTDHATNENE